MVKEDNKKNKKDNEEIKVDVKPKSGFVPFSDLTIQ